MSKYCAPSFLYVYVLYINDAQRNVYQRGVHSKLHLLAEERTPLQNSGCTHNPEKIMILSKAFVSVLAILCLTMLYANG